MARACGVGAGGSIGGGVRWAELCHGFERTIVSRVPSIGGLPDRERHDFAEALRVGWQLAHESDGDGFDPGRLGFLRALTRRLAGLGVPLRDYLTCLELCGSLAASALWATAQPKDVAALAHTFGRSMERYLALSKECLRTFLAEAGVGREHGVIPLVADAVLRGWMTPSLADAAGVPFPVRGYLVTVLPARPSVPALLAGRPPEPLWSVTGDELLLLSALGPGANAESAARERTRATIAALRPAVGAPAIGVHRLPEGVRDGIAHSRRLRMFAVAADLPGELYGPDDVLVDRCVQSDPATVAGLRIAAAALSEGPELRQTLRTLYRMNLHRGRTAEKLGVHRQTLSYRLNRVTELTGFDPVSVRGVAVLSAAIAVSNEPVGG